MILPPLVFPGWSRSFCYSVVVALLGISVSVFTISIVAVAAFTVVNVLMVTSLLHSDIVMVFMLLLFL